MARIFKKYTFITQKGYAIPSSGHFLLEHSCVSSVVCLFVRSSCWISARTRTCTASTSRAALWHRLARLHGLGLGLVLVLLQPHMENQSPRGVEVKRSKVRGGNGRGERAGTGWDGLGPKGGQSHGERRAKKTGQVSGRWWRQVQNCLSRAGIPHVPGPQGPASHVSAIRAVSASLSKLVLCFLDTDFQALLFFISVVSFKFATLVIPLYFSFHAFVVVALLLGSHPVSPLQRQAELWQGAAHSLWSQAWLVWVCLVRRIFSLGERSAGAAQVSLSWLKHTAAVPCAAAGCAPWMWAGANTEAKVKVWLPRCLYSVSLLVQAETVRAAFTLPACSSGQRWLHELSLSCRSCLRH